MKKSIIIVAIFAVILSGAFIFMKGKKISGNPTLPVTSQEAVITPTKPVSSDTSDSGIANDTAALDAKLKKADADMASIDEGLNDIQGNLSEQ